MESVVTERLNVIDRLKKFIIRKKKIFLSLILGQILSLLMCGTAVSSEYLGRLHVNGALTQTFPHYVALTMTFGSVFVYRHSNDLLTIVKDRGWKYFIAAFVDVEANYAVVMSYRYTSITSVQLLDCVTIPVVMALSCLVFSLRYRWTHYVAVVMCLSGAVSMVMVDHFLNNRTESSSYPLLGDVLVIIGASLYGVSNVFQDFSVKKYGQVEYLAFLGFFCSFICGIQLIIFERSLILSAVLLHYTETLFWSSFVGFSVSMFLIYSLMPYVMRISNSLLTNLSLLTADIYALLFSLVLFHYRFHYTYFICYTLIMLGVTLFLFKDALVVTPSSSNLISNSTFRKFCNQRCCCFNHKNILLQSKDVQNNQPCVENNNLSAL